MRFETKKSAGYLANHMARLFAVRLAERIRPLGIVPGQFPVLLALWDEDGLTQKQLVDRLAVEQATMANTLGRMERDGLVTRHPDPDDARARRVALTDKARAIEAPAKQAALEVNRQAVQGLNDKEQRAFVQAMSSVIANLSPC